MSKKRHKPEEIVAKLRQVPLDPCDLEGMLQHCEFALHSCVCCFLQSSVTISSNNRCHDLQKHDVRNRVVEDRRDPRKP